MHATTFRNPKPTKTGKRLLLKYIVTDYCLTVLKFQYTVLVKGKYHNNFNIPIIKGCHGMIIYHDKWNYWYITVDYN